MLTNVVQLEETLTEALAAAKDAIRRRAWTEAVAAYSSITTRWPNSAEGPVGKARALRYLGELNAADEALRHLLDLTPTNVAAALEYGWIAIARRDWTQAATRWLAIIAALPDNPYTYEGAAKALIDSGNWADAKLLLQNARPRFPEKIEIMIRSLEAARGQMDWISLQDLSQQMAERFPNDPRGAAAIAEAGFVASLGRLDGATPAEASPTNLLSNAHNDSSESLPNLMIDFESLGNDCEFGLVQRKFGAEPLGLLRWSAILPKQLAAALHSELDGVGSPSHTVLEIDRGEYRTRDVRYGMWMHTFIKEQSVASDVFYSQVCRRIAYLKEKLVSDISSANKIFVYKNICIENDDIDQIFNAIRKIGPRSSLFCVQLANELRPAGTIITPYNGLTLGYMDRFTTGAEGGSINFDGWLSLCQKVNAIWRQQRRAK